MHHIYCLYVLSRVRGDAQNLEVASYFMLELSQKQQCGLVIMPSFHVPPAECTLLLKHAEKVVSLRRLL